MTKFDNLDAWSYLTHGLNYMLVSAEPPVSMLTLGEQEHAGVVSMVHPAADLTSILPMPGTVVV